MHYLDFLTGAVKTLGGSRKSGKLIKIITVRQNGLNKFTKVEWRI